MSSALLSDSCHRALNDCLRMIVVSCLTVKPLQVLPFDVGTVGGDWLYVVYGVYVVDVTPIVWSETCRSLRKNLAEKCSLQP